MAGISKALNRDASEAVAFRQRVYSHGNARLVRHDAQELQVIGQLSSWSYAVEATVERASQALEYAFTVHDSGDETLIQQANIAAEVEVAKAQVIATELVLRSASELFNALGAYDTRLSKALDRHWRNARTLSSHNPVIYKTRDIGNWHVNKNAPTFIWQIGKEGD